jgi:hypothetical protein
VIGHALYQLKEHDGESNERLVVWRDLEKECTEVSCVLLSVIWTFFFFDLNKNHIVSIQTGFDNEYYLSV